MCPILLHQLRCRTMLNRYWYISRYLKSGGFVHKYDKIDDEKENDDNEDRKTLISDIIASYNTEYSSSSDNNHIISAAQSIPKFQHLYIVQLINPFNSSGRINVIGLKQESMIEQDAVANEIKRLLHLIKPATLIVQLSKDRYLNAFDICNQVPITYSLSSLLSQQHITNSVRIGLHLINYVTQNNKIRMNPYLYAVLYANDEENECSFINNIILGDIPYSNDVLNRNNESMLAQRHKYIASTTYKERQKYGAYPGIWELLFSAKSVFAVFEWMDLNKNTIKLREKDVYQFAIDMQQKLEFGQEILDASTKSMAYYTYKCVEKEEHNEDHDNVLVLCNIFTMLSFPMHFGKVNKEDIENIKQQKYKENKWNLWSLLRNKWIFNYWNGVWWSLCLMHTSFQTGIYNIDYPYLLQFGVLLPIMYPSVYIAISFRARYRVRKLQQIILKQSKKQQSETQRLTDVI